jgi:hypothetical protein
MRTRAVTLPSFRSTQSDIHAAAHRLLLPELPITTGPHGRAYLLLPYQPSYNFLQGPGKLYTFVNNSSPPPLPMAPTPPPPTCTHWPTTLPAASLQMQPDGSLVSAHAKPTGTTEQCGSPGFVTTLCCALSRLQAAAAPSERVHSDCGARIRAAYMIRLPYQDLPPTAGVAGLPWC